MNETWFNRLAEAIEADPRSMRRLSMEAGVGENFVSQMIKDRKEPGIEKVMSILDKLGAAAALYVILDLRIEDGDDQFLEMVLKADSGQRRQILGILEAIQVGKLPE